MTSLQSIKTDMKQYRKAASQKKRKVVVWFKGRGEPEPKHRPEDIFIEFTQGEEAFL